MNSEVDALTVYNGELIAGGYFTTAGGVSANNIARWNGTTWQPLGTGMGGDSHPRVSALMVYNDELIAGGYFTTAGGNVSANWARWRGCPPAACCLDDGTCRMEDSTECAALGGTYAGDGTTCTPNACPPPPGACCLGTGECLVLLKSECWANPGAGWHGAGTDCTDADQNGVADACALCGDLNNDGTVDQLDYWIMLDALGRCGPDARYAAAVAMDVNHNGCIDLVDYQAWFTCYRTANGRAFAPPAPSPPKPAGQLTPLSEAAPVLVKPAQKPPAMPPAAP
jgi:hypothetical protein